MYKVYLLRSKIKPEKSYVGLTTKLISERLSEHNNGKSKYTNTFKPWELIYYENFYCKLCAEKREIFLKSGIGYRFRKIISNNYKLIY
ncbi:MAG: Excinuclease ABC subunit C [Candidatus Woesebacteria bacterium GW2011_GWA1_33_30]|uniref:Excinuclease ABC subunit C n=1 Tax=Candidatus Woesebacteria bacterium GW2011_GWA2_33_28 TaxID=1618561 RepID=A0A0F9ZRN7_9BACT|nr:MAG: Excinuclease ABC subunit C [Candidatus Woesebacteria bacterium GW2011_GWA2_33_28]KKP47803.1 MAG: Excinuclease ABC subunit C [Candidatus Woesebacteria bacterium GW2011_GWA1_33_30]KKP49248.1 MAG: Excinuclease ABC subunit C [Microgenomates group bacterium GW2011_GWC1_33_32]KKP51615.1 MAG: Excinuclease ABC subunit C [Candidatus Woesebacteria bacterium GW2011_GWB1_33_38]